MATAEGLNWWYFSVYMLAELILIIFKGIAFIYPWGNFLSEFTLLIFLWGIEMVQNFFGKKGNLTERILSVTLALLLTVPITTGVIYLLWWQTYVLRIDIVLSIIALVLIGVQSVFAGFTLITFSSMSNLR